jgi:plasmid stabilization system protein ParE
VRKPRRFELHVSSPARRDITAILKLSLQKFGQAASLRYERLILQALVDIEADPERPGSKERPELMIEGARTGTQSAIEIFNLAVEGLQLREHIETWINIHKVKQAA